VEGGWEGGGGKESKPGSWKDKVWDLGFDIEEEDTSF